MLFPVLLVVGNTLHETCWQVDAVTLTPAQTKSRLRHADPISPLLLYRAMRITDAVLSFAVSVDRDGNVTCVESESGHPLLIGTAIDSVKNWKFRPIFVKGQRKPMVGKLILTITVADGRLKSRVLPGIPRKPQRRPLSQRSEPLPPAEP